LLALAALSGCSPLIEEERGEEKQPLNGTITWGGFVGPVCNARRTEFQAAFQRAWDQFLIPGVTTEAARVTDCLKEAVLSDETFFPGKHGEVTYPEEIMARMSENIPTRISCVDAAGGCFSSGGEDFLCDPNFMDIPTLNLAGQSAHEISHHYWDHPGMEMDYGASVPSAVYMCFATLGTASPPIPGGIQRSNMGSTETTLAQVGLEGEQPVAPTYCSATQFLSGFYGTSSDAITALGGVCKALDSARTSDLPAAGQWAGAVFRQTCSASEVAIGAFGKAGSALTAIGSLCASEADVRSGLAAFRNGLLAGNNTGRSWERRCPAFQALKGVRLRAGAQVDRIELVCQDVRKPETIRQSVPPSLTVPGEWGYSENCQSRAVLTALETRIESNVRRLGGRCQAVSAVPRPAADSAVALAGSETVHVLASHGGLDDVGTPNLDSCPADEAVVALQLYYDGRDVAGVRGICASIDGWSRRTPGTDLHPTTLRGRSTSTSDAPMCASAEFLVGWTVQTGDDGYIRGVKPVCRRFGDLDDVPLVGDFNADGRIAELSLFRPADGTWRAKPANGAVLFDDLQWGLATDVPLIGDLDSDGQLDDVAVFRPSNGSWYAKRADGSVIFTDIQWGLSGDIPLIADFDSDGELDDLGVFRPSSGTWYAKRTDNTVIFADRQWGLSGDMPLVGDFDSDGELDDLGVFRPSSGMWYAKRSDDTVIFVDRQWGRVGDVPFVADFDNDGKRDDLGVFRPGEATWWAKRTDDSVIFENIQFGLAGDVPVVGDFDADGRFNDVGVWRPSNAGWYATRTDGSLIFEGVPFGLPH